MDLLWRNMVVRIYLSDVACTQPARCESGEPDGRIKSSDSGLKIWLSLIRNVRSAFVLCSATSAAAVISGVWCLPEPTAFNTHSKHRQNQAHRLRAPGDVSHRYWPGLERSGERRRCPPVQSFDIPQ